MLDGHLKPVTFCYQISFFFPILLPLCVHACQVNCNQTRKNLRFYFLAVHIHRLPNDPRPTITCPLNPITQCVNVSTWPSPRLRRLCSWRRNMHPTLSNFWSSNSKLSATLNFSVLSFNMSSVTGKVGRRRGGKSAVFTM